MTKKMNVVAIDGPAGSGKSTIAKKTAKALGFLYIDTGAMYRALTLKAMENNVSLMDKDAVIKLSASVDIKLIEENGVSKVILDGKDVSGRIRELSVSQNVKHVAGIEQVRKNMVKLQRTMGENAKGACMEGRDIGTVVFPDAAYKIFLDAAFEERVDRRFKEFLEKNIKATRQEVAKDLAERDHSDKTRKVGPLKQAEDAVYLDTTKLTIGQVVEKILAYVKGKSI